MACEPDSDQKDRIRQPRVPAGREVGIIFTYMGPPEKQPMFPRISICENLADDEEIVSGGGLAGRDNPASAPTTTGGTRTTTSSTPSTSSSCTRT